MSDASATPNPYQCPKCWAPIPSGQSLKTCPKCHGKLPEGVLNKLQEAQAVEDVGNGSAALCVALGILALCAGLYFLVFNPGTSRYSDFVNAHALAMGQAFTISGAILLGFGIRPR